jgi:hypothetical protein
VVAVDRGAAVAERSLDPPLDGDMDAVDDDEMVNEEVALDRGLRHRARWGCAVPVIFRIVVDAEIAAGFIFDVGAVRQQHDLVEFQATIEKILDLFLCWANRKRR